MTSQESVEASRYDRGLRLLQQVAGVERPAVLDTLDPIAPDLARYTVEFAYGDIYGRPDLGLRERQLSTVAALTAMGNAAPQLLFHVNGALNVGCSPRDVVETMIHATVYAGFPAALNAIFVAKEAFDARPDLPPAHDGAGAAEAADRYERGLAALAEIDGNAGDKVIASLADVAPDLGRYIIEYSFGDVYCRGGLDLRTREIVTIAMCAALGTARPQLKVHVHGLLNVGGTREEVIETCLHIAVYAGFPAALNAIAAAREVFEERDANGR
jgi:4-carboxymuconolactone decarboxylase